MLHLLLSLLINTADAQPFRHRPPMVRHYRYDCCVVVLTRPALPPKFGFYHVWDGHQWIEVVKSRQDIVYVAGHYDPYGYWIPGFWKLAYI